MIAFIQYLYMCLYLYYRTLCLHSRSARCLRFVFIFVFVRPFAFIHDHPGACELYGRDYDHGEDYLSWTRVSSLGQCMEKCKSTYNCDGITWVKNYNRHFSLKANGLMKFLKELRSLRQSWDKVRSDQRRTGFIHQLQLRRWKWRWR